MNIGHFFRDPTGSRLRRASHTYEDSLRVFGVRNLCQPTAPEARLMGV